MRDHTRSLERRSWNVPAICAAVEKALFPHHVFEKRELALVDEEHQLAGFGEVGLRGEEGRRSQSCVPVAGHRSGSDREHGAADAIAHRMNLAFRHDCRHRVERRHDAQLPVIFHRETAILGPRILPRDHEHGVALLGQVFDQRVMRAQVEDVVLHDPRGHDQHRFGMNLFVAGAYWISSISRLRKTTLPGVTATLRPT